jgi:tripartite-type tricarboxylate transporter receptor subunit TctC
MKNISPRARSAVIRFGACIASLGLIALLGLIASAPQVMAEGVDFAGKSITIIVPYDAGGTTDFEARAAARYLPDALPGKPAVVVRNMPGGGGLVGLNYTGEVAKNDGLTLIMWSWNAIAHLVKDPGLRVPMGKFRSVGGLVFGNVTFMRVDSAQGVAGPNDILKAKKLWFGGLGATNFKDIMGRLHLDILGVKYDYLNAYQGANDLVLAFAKDEITITDMSQATWVAQVKPNYVDKGLAVPVFQLGVWTDKGVVRHRDLQDIRTFQEAYQELHGKPPSGDLWELYSSFMMPMRSSMSDVVWLAPGTPDDIVQAHRKAFEAVMNGQQFTEDYNRFVHSDPVWISGAQGQTVLDKLDTADPAQVKKLNDYVNMARNR